MSSGTADLSLLVGAVLQRIGSEPETRRALADGLEAWTGERFSTADVERYSRDPALVSARHARALAAVVLRSFSDESERELQTLSLRLGRAADDILDEAGQVDSTPAGVVEEARSLIGQIVEGLPGEQVEAVRGELGFEPQRFNRFLLGPSGDFERGHFADNADDAEWVFAADEQWLMFAVDFAFAVVATLDPEENVSVTEAVTRGGPLGKAFLLLKVLWGVGWIAELWEEDFPAAEPPPLHAENPELSEIDIRVLAEALARRWRGFGRERLDVAVAKYARRCRSRPERVKLDLCHAGLLMAQDERLKPQPVKIGRKWITDASGGRREDVVPARELSAEQYGQWLRARGYHFARLLLLGGVSHDVDLSPPDPNEVVGEVDVDAVGPEVAEPKPRSARPGVVAVSTSPLDPGLRAGGPDERAWARRDVEELLRVAAPSERLILEAWRTLAATRGRRPDWPEVAVYLGKSVGSVDQALCRLRKRLRKKGVDDRPTRLRA